MKKINQQGYNLVELAMAVLILGVMASAVISARSYMAKQTVKSSDQTYATQKAIQMFEELKTLVNGNEQAGVAILDDYSDGSHYNTVLTTDKVVDTGTAAANPGDPLSGNKTANGHWRYMRQVQINRVANDPNTRQAIVKIWRYASDSNPNSPGDLLATVGGMLRTIQSLHPPTQVMDLYVLALSNVPGWWVQVPLMKAIFSDVISDLQSRNPGLEFRTHLISRTAYGRDSQYLPFINQASGTDVTASSWAYLYPGKAPTDSAGGEQFFYDPGSTGVLADGSFNVDGTVNQPSDSQFSTCPEYTVADENNHGMRYPDELNTYKAVTAAWATATAANGGASVCAFPEISERMLMEGMLSSPQSFMNSMVINLHGELFPMPTMRNYSDPAKDPAGTDQAGDAYDRIVTHPELIYYPTASTATVRLRVYAYEDGLDDPTSLPADGPLVRVPAMTVFLPDLNLSSANVAVSAIVGMYSSGGAVTNYKLDQVLNGGSAADNSAVSWSLQTVGAGSNQTLIKLYNTSLRCAPAANGTGLNSSYLLYNTEYIPCSPEVTANLTNSYSYTFTAQDLTSTTSAQAKNTARWIITLSNVPVTAMVSGGATIAHVVETRFGALTGANNVPINNAPPNLSRTYFWVGNTNPPPVTEQFQFMGDPRHCPYLDVKVGGIRLGAGQSSTIQNDGYNWYFKKLSPAPVDGYSGFDQAGAVTGWGDQNVEIDVPRYFQMFRQGFMNTTSVFAGINGLNEFYLGLGGEMGANTAPYSNGVTYKVQPWNSGATASTSNVCEILQTAENGWVGGAGAYVNKRLVASTSTNWYEKNWLGELYPDSLYSIWSANGNLPTLTYGAAHLNFYRKDYNSVASSGTTAGFGRAFGNIAERSANDSFLNGSTDGTTSGNWFQQQAPSTGSATIYNLATTCYGLFQYPLGTVMDCNREWSINWTGTTNTSSNARPSEWSIAPYNTKPTMSIPSIGGLSRLFYNSNDASAKGPWNGAGVVQLDDSSNSKRAYYVVSGLSPSANTGVAELGKTVMVCIMRTFLDGGQMAATQTYGHIVQMPLVKLWTNIVPQYSNPSTIPMVISSPVTGASPVTIDGLVIPNAPVTNVWFRFPSVTSNTGNVYTEEYPNYAQPITLINGSTYMEPVSLVYNLKYSNDAGVHWYFMQDNVAATQGVVDVTNSRAMTVTGSNPVTWYNWDVSNAGTFPQGNYSMMVEAYRLSNTTNQLYSQHYSYHTVDVTINR